MNGMFVTLATYDRGPVVLSIVIACLACFAAMDFAERVMASRGRARCAWLSGSGLVLGCGLWTMHLTALVACRIPGPVFYHVPTLLLALLAAVAGCTLGFCTATSERPGAVAVICKSLAMGIGIAAMHSMAMAAMRISAVHVHAGPAWLSIAMQVVFVSLVCVALRAYFQERDRSWTVKCGIALLMGLIFPAIHYVETATDRFVPTTLAPDLTNSISMSAPVQSTILLTTLSLLILSLIVSLAGRRHAAQHSALDNELNMLRGLIDNISDFVFVKDLDSRWVVVNSRLAGIVGKHKSPQDLLGKTDSDFFPAEIAKSIYDDDRNVIRSGQPLDNREETLVDQEGNEIHLLTSKVPLRDRYGNIIGIAGIGRDISIRKKMEDALREAEQKYRGIFDEAIVGIFQSTPAGRFLNVNRSMALKLGYDDPKDMIDSVTEMAQFYADPSCRTHFEELMETAGRVQNFECQALRKDGSQISLSMSVRAVRENGIVVRYDGMCEDVTERNELREQLFQAQKLESVGQLAAGIAHEINTPTQYIGDNVHFLGDAFHDLTAVLDSYRQMLSATKNGTLSDESIRKIEADIQHADPDFLAEEIPRAIEQTLEGIARVSTLVSAMKEFSHPGTKRKVPLDLNHAIQSTITVARNEWKYVADVEARLDPALRLVPSHPGEFNQVILNLIVNAAHAIADVIPIGEQEKGMILIETRDCPEFAEIRVQDTGSGIPEKIRSRVFDPFFTTKEIGKGTGQGLAIARSVVVDKHAGTIQFETEVGKGTTFIVRLPYEGNILTPRTTAA